MVFSLSSKLLRRGFQLSKLEVQRVQYFEDFYRIVRYSHNCGYFKFELA